MDAETIYEGTEYIVLEEIPVTPFVFPNSTSDPGKLPYELDVKEVIRNNIVFKVHSLVYTCSTCERKFNNTGNFERHIQSHKTGRKAYMCDSCPREFSSYTKYLQHREDHTLTCALCQLPFRTVAELSIHKRANHQEDRPFQCLQCGKGFRTAWVLRQHQLSHQAASHRCEFCSKSYKRKEDLLRHYESH